MTYNGTERPPLDMEWSEYSFLVAIHGIDWYYIVSMVHNSNVQSMHVYIFDYDHGMIQIHDMV